MLKFSTGLLQFSAVNKFRTSFAYTGFRLVLELVFSLWLTATLVFILLRVLPGDTAAIMGGMNAQPAELDTIRTRYGLDQPVLFQYVQWLGNLFSGSLGESFLSHEPVIALIMVRLPYTLLLAIMAMFFAMVIAIPIGFYSALHTSKTADRLITGFLTLLLSIPEFWLGLLLLLLFSIVLSWVPLFPSGLSVGTLILPAIALALSRAAILARSLRTTLQIESQKEYILALRTFGMSQRRIVLRHQLPNSLSSFITLSGIQFGYLLGGAVVIEQVFSLPGMGRLILNAIQNRDLPLIQGAVLVLATAFVLSNFLTELLGRLTDPRLNGKNRL